MSQASNYLEEVTLNYFLRHQVITQPKTLYLALYKTNPTDNDTGTEINGGDYKRQSITFGPPSQYSEVAQTSNLQAIEFPIATDSWGDVAYFGIRDNETEGNLLVYGAFNKPTSIDAGNKFIIDVGNITIGIS